jgi:hypothetical protein
METAVASLTLAVKEVTDLITPNQLDGMLQDADAQRVKTNAMADAIIVAAQTAVIADLIAATITTNTVTFATTFIDFAPITVGSVVGEAVMKFLQPMNQKIMKVVAAHSGSSFNDFWFVLPTLAGANLMSLAQIFPGAVPFTWSNTELGLDFRYMGFPTFMVDATTFGLHSNHVGFFGHKTAYGFTWNGVRPWRGGVPVADADVWYRQTFYGTFAYGLLNEAGMAQVLNPKS